MLLKQFFVEKIAHSSYILAGQGTCAVVDPERNVDVYLETARSLGVRITHILETHLHADFVSGHMDLRDRTGADVYAPRSAKCSFEHVPLKDGDTVSIEDIRLDVLETPGHTPEHLSYVVVDTSRSDEPCSVFTGDALFVGDVGRPDLFPGRARELAGRLYRSLHEKLLKLPDYCEVLPAHGAGSLCGRSMAAKRASTIGYEKRFNKALRVRSEDKFITSLTTGMPPAPDHFARLSDVNRRGPGLVSSIPMPEALGPAKFSDLAAGRGTVVLDVRDYDAYGGQHIRDAVSIPFAGSLPTFAGWLVPEKDRVAIVADDREQAIESVVWLRRVGLDRTPGYLENGMFSWARSGYPTAHAAVLSASEVHAAATGDDPITLLDVRARPEFEASHVDGAVNIPAPELRTRYRELEPTSPVIVMCSSGHRASTAVSILESRGFTSLHNAAGGYIAYSAAGFAESCTTCAMSHGPRFVEVQEVGSTSSGSPGRNAAGRTR